MAWTAGTATLTNAQKLTTITGVDALVELRVGWAFVTPEDGTIYEISRIISTNQIEITPAWAGATVEGATFRTIPNNAPTLELTRRIGELLATYQEVVDTIGTGRFKEGSVAAPSVRSTAADNTGLDIAAELLRLVVAGISVLEIGRDEITATRPINGGALNLSGTASALAMRAVTAATDTTAEIVHFRVDQNGATLTVPITGDAATFDALTIGDPAAPAATIDAGGGFTGSGVMVSAGTPVVRLHETDFDTTRNQTWLAMHNGLLSVQTRDDAGNPGSVNASFAPAGTAVPDSGTTITREKGDARYMQPGAYGLGTEGAPLPPNDNADLAVATGWYSVQSGTLNHPLPGNGVLRVESRGGSRAHQTIYNIGGGTMTGTYTRISHGSNPTQWTPWRRVFDQEGIVGTVSQSGGIPTGGIIEKGSNSNGYYIRFADGTQICSGIGATLATSEAAGPIYRSANETLVYAATFSNTPRLGLAVEYSSGGMALWAGQANAGSISMAHRILSTAASGQGRMTYIAHGFWF